MKNYNSKYFKVRIKQQKDKVILLQQILNPVYCTNKLPATVSVLSKNIPSIFDNICFNYFNLPFKEEVKNTEVGHLFEHLILENLKIETLKNSGLADFRGETRWNWAIEDEGTYNITISMSKKNTDIFNKAFLKSVSLLEEIYNSSSSFTGAGNSPRPAIEVVTSPDLLDVHPDLYLHSKD